MSSSSSEVKREDINALVEAVRALSLQVDHLAQAFDKQDIKRFADEWEVIEECSLPCGATPQQLTALYHFRTAEDGPPSLPAYCSDLAVRSLKGVDPGPLVRADRAFKAGFWSKIAVETHTPYYWADPIGVASCHWVVLRAGERLTPVRFNRKSDYNLFVSGIREHDIVSESFASLTELSIYCVGAGIRLPALKVWRKAN